MYYEENPRRRRKLWVRGAKTRWTPRPGLFLESAGRIADEVLRGHNWDLAGSVSSLDFYINRGGSNLTIGERARLREALRIVRRDGISRGEQRERGADLARLRPDLRRHRIAANPGRCPGCRADLTCAACGTECCERCIDAADLCRGCAGRNPARCAGCPRDLTCIACGGSCCDRCIDAADLCRSCAASNPHFVPSVAWTHKRVASCPNCGVGTKEGRAKCWNCGHALEWQAASNPRCPGCGVSVDDLAERCWSCGGDLRPRANRGRGRR